MDQKEVGLGRRRQVVIVGCGVSGLSCAYVLQRAGFRVTIWARTRPDEPPFTTSNAAGALWRPYRVFGDRRVARWRQVSMATFRRLAKQPERTGVRVVEGLELFREEHVMSGLARRPAWCAEVEHFQILRRNELPPKYAKSYERAWSYRTPLIDTPIYLKWLVDEVEAYDGPGGSGEIVCPKTVEDLSEALEHCHVVVNSTGAWAKYVAHDSKIFPARGQVGRAGSLSSKRFVIDEHHPRGLTYVFPRSGDSILGGTREEGDWDLNPRGETREEIVSRCSELVPEVSTAEVFEDLVGLRPERRPVRLALERRGSGRVVIHNYGHGGSGFTLSWGCAQDVLQRVVRHYPGST
jgi:D-amino-acid oxidase